MHLSKLTILLKSLTALEVENLHAFLASPYFNAPTTLPPFFKYLATLHPFYKEADMQPRIIAKKVKGIGIAKSQSNLGTDLYKQVELFLSVEVLRQSKADQTLNLLSTQVTKNLSKNFAITAAKFEKELQADTEHGVTNLYHRHLLIEYTFNDLQARLQRGEENDISPVLTSLDKFYAIKKLRYHCEQVCRKFTLNIPYQPDNIAYLLQVLQPCNEPKYQYIYVFIQVYHLFTATTYDEFNQAHTLLQQVAQQYTSGPLPDSIRECAAYCQNACLKWNAMGYLQGGHSFLWWVDWRIQNNEVLINSNLDPTMYRLVVMHAVRCNRPAAFIANYIKTYSPYLPTVASTTELHFAQALYLYRTQQYKAALATLELANTSENYKLDGIARRWKFILLYELDKNDIDALHLNLQTFTRQIDRNKDELHGYYVPLQQFIAACKKLIAYQHQSAHARKYAVELAAKPYFAQREWILEQLQKKRP